MKRFQLIISMVLFAGVIGAGVWLYFETRAPEPESTLSKMLEQDVDMAMSGEVRLHEISSGRLSLELFGQDLAYNEKSGRVRIEQPRIRAYPPGEGTSFFVQGDRGFYFLNLPEFEIRGRVSGESDEGYLLETEWLRYSPEKRLVETDAQVVIKRSEGSGGLDFKLTGRGVKFDLDHRVLLVSSDAKLVVKRLNQGE
jgi:LPS export ABC transporter protein LptC